MSVAMEVWKAAAQKLHPSTAEGRAAFDRCLREGLKKIEDDEVRKHAHAMISQWRKGYFAAFTAQAFSVWMRETGFGPDMVKDATTAGLAPTPGVPLADPLDPAGEVF